MNLKLVRTDFTETSTIGTLYINGVEECFILEDKDRGLNDSMPLTDIEKIKIKHLTAIPYGHYKVVVTKSNRFSQMAGHDVYLPLLLNVKGYEGIRIHKGNYATNSSGCLLPGKKKGVNVVINSTDSFNQLNEKINDALKLGEIITIEITK